VGEVFHIVWDWIYAVARGLAYMLAWLGLIILSMTIGEYWSRGSR
jgi:hypothetical protein